MCLCAVIETWMTFQPEKYLVKTRVWPSVFRYFSGWNDVMNVSVTVQRYEIYYLFVLWPRFLRVFLTLSMSLYSNKKWKWCQRVSVLWENGDRPIRACVGRVLFHKGTYTRILFCVIFEKFCFKRNTYYTCTWSLTKGQLEWLKIKVYQEKLFLLIP